MKYVLKESELVSVLENIISEEITAMVNEGIGRAIKSGLKLGALAAISPFTAAGKLYKGTTQVLTGKKKLGDALFGPEKDEKDSDKKNEKNRKGKQK